MKYYSEILNKTFDTVKELETAEKTEKERIVADAKAASEKRQRIDDAKAKMEAAYLEYDKARTESDSKWSEYMKAKNEYLELVTPDPLNRLFLKYLC